jgi:hypothetical protein
MLNRLVNDDNNFSNITFVVFRFNFIYIGCTLIRTHPYPDDVPLLLRFLVEMRCTDKGTPSVVEKFWSLGNSKFQLIFKKKCKILDLETLQTP